MNKRFILIALLLAAIGGGTVLLLHWYSHTSDDAYLTEKDLIEANRKLHREAPPAPAAPAPLPASRTMRLAIGSLGLPNDAQNAQLADLVTAELSGAAGLELVDRSSLEAVLREQSLSLSGIVRAKDAVRVGKLLRADWFLLGTGETVTHTNPTLVARIVDARTGIMHDVAVFDAAGNTPALAKGLAGFVKQCREGASSSQPRTFLGIGTFANVGISTRQSEFPPQLKAYLTSTYQASRVTLLEREQVNALLQEVRLDLAGLTETNGTNPPSPMQSAFWLVNGFYQAYGPTGRDVEVMLQVHRIFGRTTNFTFCAAPDAALLGQIKAAIDVTMSRSQGVAFAPTRSSEASQQFTMGRDLFVAATGGWHELVSPGYGTPRGMGENDIAKRGGYLTEAVRAFETVLLLQPDNREAKFYLSACYRDPAHEQPEEGFNYLRELAGGSVEDNWAEAARIALAEFYKDTDPQQSARWYNELVNHAKTAEQAAIYRSFAQDELDRVARQQGIASVELLGMPAVKARLFAQVEEAYEMLAGRSATVGECSGLCEFVRAFGTNRVEAARQVLGVLPVLTNKHPEMTHYLLSCAAAFQLDTNAPVVAEFRKSLAACMEQPEKVFGCPFYFQNLMLAPYIWCISNNLPSLALQLVEAKQRAAQRRPEVGFEQEDEIRLAFAYIYLQRWQDALAVLDRLGDINVGIYYDGPWGRNPIRPARLAAYCRQKLGLAPVAKTGLATLSESCLCLHTPAAFAASSDGLWIAIGRQLLQLGFDLRTNKIVNLPLPGYADITALYLTPEHCWIGTAGDGLVQYDRASGKSHLMTQKDGLLLDYISALCLQDKTLWIGFGRGSDGGLGWLDLRDGHLTALTPRLSREPNQDPLLAKNQEPLDQAPRHAVGPLGYRAPNELWMMAVGRWLCRYRIAENAWDRPTFDSKSWALTFTVDGDRLLGGFGFDSDRGGYYTRYEIRECRSGEQTWRKLGGDRSLPSLPSAFCRDGNNLWFGGKACVGVLDLAQDKVRAIQTIPAEGINHIEVGGGYLWVQYDQHLHKAALADIH
jgi:hypothetical protein